MNSPSSSKVKKPRSSRGIWTTLLLLFVAFSVWARVREKSIRAEHEQGRIEQKSSSTGFVCVGIK